MDDNIYPLMKLKQFEHYLTTMLEKIDKDIIKTDVEWLHLKSLVEGNEFQSSKQDEVAVDSKRNNVILDDPEINMTELKLDIQEHFAADTEEFDSD